MKQLSVLAEISAALAAAGDMRTFAGVLGTRSKAIVPFDTCLLALPDPARRTYAVWRGDGALVDPALPMPQGIPGWVIRTGERLLLEGPPAASLRIRSPRLAIGDAKGILALPLVGEKGQTTGSLLFLTQQGRMAARSDLPMASVLAALVATTVRQTLRAESQATTDGFIYSLARAIEAKDPYTEGHGGRVAEYALALGRRAGLSASELGTLFKGGFLHDVGKIGIQDSVLFKQGALSEAEYAHMKQHPEIGSQLLRALPASDPLIPMIRHHHERWDGHGYPDGLYRDEPPLMARIVSIADAFDAMTSTRCYRPARPVAQGLAILAAHSGKQWDPDLTGMFVELVKRRVQDKDGTRFPA